MPASATPLPATQFPAIMFRDCLVLIACFIPLGCSSSSTPPTATQPTATAARDTAASDSAPPGEASSEAAQSASGATSTADSDDSSATAKSPGEPTEHGPSPTEPTAVASARPSTDQPAPAGTTPPAESSDASASGYHEPAALDVYPTADFTVTADEFFAEHEADEEAWKRKYEGKVVEVRGKLDSFNNTFYNYNLLFFRTRFAASVRQDRPWLDHPPGSTIVLRGKIPTDGGLLGAAYIVESEPGPPIPEVTPQQLHERFTADQDAFDEEFERKYVVVKGTLLDRQPGEFEETWSLGANGQGMIDLEVDNFVARGLHHWQPGDDIVVLGRYRSFGSDERPLLQDVLPVSPLLDYPPLPALQQREIDGAQVPVRTFTAVLLGRWIDEYQRALILTFDSDPPDSQLEVQGEVLSVEKAEAFLGEEVEVRLQDGYGGLLRFNLDKPMADKLGVKPGASMTVRGQPFGEMQGMRFLAPEVEME
jgi:hypothetical protein